MRCIIPTISDIIHIFFKQFSPIDMQLSVVMFVHCTGFAFALGREVGLEKLQMSFPTSVILIPDVIMKFT